MTYDNKLYSTYKFFFSDERVRDESIANPTKKFEIETYNMVMDRTLFELSERFKSTNIGPLRDLSLLSVRRIEEINKNPKCLPQDAFSKLCETYSLNKEELTMEYLQFCRNFYDIRDGIKLPTYINKNANFDFENDELKNDEESDDELDLNVYNDDKLNEQPHKE